MNFPEWQRIKDRYFWQTALMIARNAITRQYQNSYLGMVWTIIMPLIQVIIFVIIMPLIMHRIDVNYPLYLIASFPLWCFISASLIGASKSILEQAETLKRCVVPSVVFPIADVMRQFFTYLVSFATMYGFCLLFYTSFDPVLLWLPVLLVPIFVVVVSLSIAIAYVAPYVRDVGELFQVCTNIAFWFTPVIYPLSAVPVQYHWLFWLNPFFLLMHPVQRLIVAHELPGPLGIFCLFAVTAGAVLFSALLYRKCRRNFVYYL